MQLKICKSIHKWRFCVISMSYIFNQKFNFLPAHTPRVQAGTESELCLFLGLSAVISSSSSSPSSLEEGSSQTCVWAVPRDLSLYDIMSGIRWLLLHSNTVCCTILSVERCSLGNTSLHRDKMTPPLQEYSSVLYYTILYYTKRFVWSQQYQARENYVQGGDLYRGGDWELVIITFQLLSSCPLVFHVWTLTPHPTLTPHITPI